MVSAPVLENSLLLTDKDLLNIIAQRPQPGALGDICRRKNLCAGVGDGIVATKDKKAVAELLANSRAQIREETLGRLIDEARHVEIWHKPMVHWPALTEGAVIRLADNYFSVLEQREDLDTVTIAKVKLEIHRGIESSDVASNIAKRNRKMAMTPSKLSVRKQIIPWKASKMRGQ